MQRTLSNDLYAWTEGYDVSRSYEVNGLNQYDGTPSGGVDSGDFAYDANGNLAATTLHTPEGPVYGTASDRTLGA